MRQRTLALEPGTRLGPYTVSAYIGAGGMGEVYRATDTRLGRDVAIKVLPQSLAQDPDRLARFDREARTLAALNHPNIAAILGLEEASGTKALVMELVDGEDLAQRIARGAIPIDEALPIAKQIADALEAAHEQGIVHRDLKPANVKVRTDGTVKVLDFGLAKAMEPGSGTGDRGSGAASLSPTITSPAMMTGVGMILGTAAYMSPEQARGRTVDRRSDIWSFGAVLFEMLSGRRAFAGETVTDTLAQVLEREPDWQLLSRRTPVALRQLVGRCLVKNPGNRLQAIGDARITLQEVTAHPDAEHTAPASQPVMWKRVLPWALAPVLLIAGFLIRPPASSPDRPGSKFEYPLPIGQVLAHGSRHAAEISPDGTRIAFTSNSLAQMSVLVPSTNRIYVKTLNQWDPVSIAGTDGGVNPFFAPDGQSLGFRSGSQLKTVSLAGGSPTVLAENIGTLNGYTWGRNGIIVFGRGFSEGLKSIRQTGGEVEAFTELDPAANEISHRLPHFLPDGSAVLFTVVRYTSITPDWKRAEVWVKSLATGERKRLLEDATDARYAGNGLLTFARQGRLFAIRFDPEKLSVSGTPVLAVDGVTHSLYGQAGVMWTGAAQYSVSENGTLLYAPGSIEPPFLASLSWVDRQGAVTPVGAKPASLYGARVSADGKRIAYSEYHVAKEIWVFDTVRGTTDRQTYEGQNMFPVWAPDDSRIAFRSDRAGPIGVFVTQGMNSRNASALTPGPLDTPGSWTPDGKTLAFGRGFPLSNTANSDIFVVSADRPQDARPLVNTAANERFPEFSPDGKWLAYCSDETGKFELYVQPYPGPGRRVTVTSDGASEPAWSRDGNELFYRNNTWMMAVRFRITEDQFVPEKPVQLFDLPSVGGGADVRSQYDTVPGGRFLMILPVPGQNDDRNRRIFPSTLRIVLNWTAEVQRLFSTVSK